MSNAISENTRKTLFHSLAAVESNKAAIIAGMSDSLAADEADHDDLEQAEATVMLLVDMLIEQARYLIDGDRPQDLEAHAIKHQLHGIDGRHYSRFGDALVTVLRDVLGARLPRHVASAWCDSFWVVIRSMKQLELAPVPELVRA